MARVPYLEPSDLAPENRDLLARNINLYRALVHSPEGTRSFLTLAKYIRFHSPLDPRLREIAILQVGYLTQIALRVFAPHQDRSRFRSDRRRHPRDRSRNEGTVDQPVTVGQGSIAGGARVDGPAQPVRRHFHRAEKGPRQPAAGRSAHDDFLLRRSRAPAGCPANRCRGRLPAVPAGVSAAGVSAEASFSLAAATGAHEPGALAARTKSSKNRGV